MKRLLIYFSLLFTLGLILTGCYKDINIPPTVSDPEGPPQAVNYNAELSPLFNSSCALSGCHLSGGHHPYLNSEISYNELINGGFVNTVVPKQSILYIMINSDMKTYIPSAEDRQKVYDWIRNGAPNN
jgi:hypothetical protein